MYLPRIGFALLALMLIVSSHASFAGENWPGFRGPTGMGLSDEKSLPLKWGGAAGENVLWKSPLHGNGHASPIVWGESVIVCTVFWPPDNKQQAATMPEHHVTSYNTTTGRENWNTQVPPGPWRRQDFRSGPGGGYAACTPVTDGKLIYCVFGSSVMAALDFSGKIIWRKEIIPSSFDVTVGSSPVLHNDTVIMLCAMAKSSDSSLIAFDKATGDVKWQQKFPDMGFGHSTPVIININNQPQMLVLATGMKETANGLRSLDPANGRTLWWCKGAGDASSPAFGSGIVYFDSGRGGKGYAVDPTGKDDVSASHTKWTINNIPEAIGSPLIVNGHVHRLHNPGILKCWEAASGKEIYTQRLAGLSTTWASPIVDADGRIYFANAGKSVIIQSGPEYKVLAENDLGDSNHCSPAVAGGKLFLVGQKSIFCICAAK